MLIVKDRSLIIVYRVPVALDLSAEGFRACVRISLAAGSEVTCGTPLEGDADPVPGRICPEIFETSSSRAVRRDRFRLGRDASYKRGGSSRDAPAGEGTGGGG